MAITTEEKEYFLEGIKRVFRKTTNINLAKSFNKDDEDSVSIIKRLEDITDYVRDFVAAVSAKGVMTPMSIIRVTQTDIGNIKQYVGFDEDEDDVTHSKKPSLKKSIDKINKIIGGEDLSSFKDPIITSCLNELYKSISEIFQILGVDKGGRDHPHSYDVPVSDSETHIISGEYQTLTSCIYNRKTKDYSLGKVITISSPTAVGIQKSIIECSNWAKSKIPHYFTTGGVEGCSKLGYIPEGLALPECISALGIHIE